MKSIDDVVVFLQHFHLDERTSINSFLICDMHEEMSGRLLRRTCNGTEYKNSSVSSSDDDLITKSEGNSI